MGTQRESSSKFSQPTVACTDQAPASAVCFDIRQGLDHQPERQAVLNVIKRVRLNILVTYECSLVSWDRSFNLRSNICCCCFNRCMSTASCCGFLASDEAVDTAAGSSGAGANLRELICKSRVDNCASNSVPRYQAP